MFAEGFVGLLFWILFVFIGLMVIAGLAVVLPVRVSFRLAGGTDEGFAYSGRILFFGGIIGGAVGYEAGTRRLSAALRSHQFCTVNIQPLINRLTRKKKKVKPEKKAREKKPLIERLKKLHRQITTAWQPAKRGYGYLLHIVRIDRFHAAVQFGLAKPALMGKLIGAIFIINALLPKPFSITQTFDFTRQAVQGELNTVITIRMYRFWKVVFVHIPVFVSMAWNYRKKNEHMPDNTIAQEVV